MKGLEEQRSRGPLLLWGAKEMSTTAFLERANFIYNEMNSSYDEQQLVVKSCTKMEEEGKTMMENCAQT